MIYAEALRVRRAFSIFAAILTAIALIIIISSQASHHGGSFTITIDGGRQAVAHRAVNAKGNIPVPLGLLFGIAGFLAMAFSTSVATSLNRENERAGFVFTKPISRARLALAYMAVDVAAIFAAFAYSLAVFYVIPLLSISRPATLVAGPQDVAIAFLGLGAALLWYGVLQAVTAGVRGRGGMFVGFSWVTFLLLIALASMQFGPIFHGIVMVLNVVNPLAYFSAVSTRPPGSGGVDVSSIFDLPTATRAALTWCLAAAGCAAAIFAWKRVEV